MCFLINIGIDHLVLVWSGYPECMVNEVSSIKGAVNYLSENYNHVVCSVASFENRKASIGRVGQWQ